MPVRSLKNPYQGIDAHLNSLLQTSGTDSSPAIWHTFHTSHIGHIADFLNNVLPINYMALSEQSLQIRTEDAEGVHLLQREPDVAVYGSASERRMAATAAALPLERALEETLDISEHFVKAAIIREIDEHDTFGQVVARIELLSPSNKPGHSGYDAYRKGRNEALYSFVPLIELDYLHETSLPFNEPRTQAFCIIVSDPRPSVNRGRAQLYNFDVDTPFPAVQIPLAGNDRLTFDFGAAYQHTHETARWGRLIDYASLPARFETYSQADQERIRAVMQRVSVP